jgi:hypothetical protein
MATAMITLEDMLFGRRGWQDLHHRMGRMTGSYPVPMPMNVELQDAEVSGQPPQLE